MERPLTQENSLSSLDFESPNLETQTNVSNVINAKQIPCSTMKLENRGHLGAGYYRLLCFP